MAIQSVVENAMSQGTLCSQLETSAGQYNVSSLMPSIAINSLCYQTPIFATVFVPGPSQLPTLSPSGTALKPPDVTTDDAEKRKFIEFKTVVLLAFMVLIGILRFGPSLRDIYAEKKVPQSDHLYSILVVLNDEENAVLENIRHADIAFYRELNFDYQEHAGWMMNTTGEIFERRQEVQFFDIYGLLGKSETYGKEVQTVTTEAYSRSAGLQRGMIIQARPAEGWISNIKGNTKKPSPAASNEVVGSYLDGYSVAPVKAKKTGQSQKVLQQLPQCYSKNNSVFTSDAETIDNVSDIETSCGSYKSRKVHSFTDFDTTDTDFSQISGGRQESTSSPVNADSKYKVMTHSNHLLWLKCQANAHLQKGQMLTSRSLDLSPSVRSSLPHNVEGMRRSRPSTQETTKASSLSNNGLLWNNRRPYRNQNFTNNSATYSGRHRDHTNTSNRLGNRFEEKFAKNNTNTFNQGEEKYDGDGGDTEEEKEEGDYEFEKDEEKEEEKEEI